MEKSENYGLEAIDNPEWLKVDVDAKQHILHGIKRDGTVDWTTCELSPKELEELEKRITLLEK